MDDRINEPAIDIEAIRWERINLVIEGRVADRTARDAFDPASPRLVQDYIAERDFYEPFESFVPGRIVSTFPELLDAIRRDEYDADKVAEFAARHFAHLDGGASDRVIDELIQGEPA